MARAARPLSQVRPGRAASLTGTGRAPRGVGAIRGRRRAAGSRPCRPLRNGGAGARRRAGARPAPLPGRCAGRSLSVGPGLRAARLRGGAAWRSLRRAERSLCAVRGACGNALKRDRVCRRILSGAEIADKARVGAVSSLSLPLRVSGRLLPGTSGRVAAPLEKKGLFACAGAHSAGRSSRCYCFPAVDRWDFRCERS